MTEAILVTGLTGLIGGAVARRLADAGRTVVGMDRVTPADVSFVVMTTTCRMRSVGMRQSFAIASAKSFTRAGFLADAPARRTFATV